VKRIALFVVIAARIHAQDGWQWLPAESLQINVRPSLETVLWAGDTPPVGLGSWRDDVFLAPRLRLSLDAAAGQHWFLHVNAAWDRGFDPGARTDGDIRLDEAFLRCRPFDDQTLNLQLGKFSSFFGGWAVQNDFFDDPFLLAPLPYSHIIGIQTRDSGALAPGAITARARGLAPAFSSLDKQNWASTLWGPGYAMGAAIFGSSEQFDFAVEIKNAGLSAHPDSWEEFNFANPTVTTRVGYRPDAAWAFGASGSHGTYLEKGTGVSLPGSVDRGELARSSAGIDARWAHHALILSGEVIYSEFETLAAGDLETVSWYLQARLKAAPGFWLAGRFGQIFANRADGADGVRVEWQPDVWRAEIGAGWRITPQFLLKASYCHTHAEDDDAAGENLFGLGIGYQF
jgi:hypothetical protein